jgi:hypothetical protein
MAQNYRTQWDGLLAIAIGFGVVEHFDGPQVRDHFTIGGAGI